MADIFTGIRYGGVLLKGPSSDGSANQGIVTDGSGNLSFGSVGDLASGAVDAIGEIASGLKSGADGTLVTGTAGTSGNLSQWNADGDLVDGPSQPSGDLVGTTAIQTLSFKTLASPTLSGTTTYTNAGSGSDPTLASNSSSVELQLQGQLTVLQQGGTDGTDEFTLAHDGTDATLTAASGGFKWTTGVGRVMTLLSGGALITDQIGQSSNRVGAFYGDSEINLAPSTNGFGYIWTAGSSQSRSSFAIDIRNNAGTSQFIVDGFGELHDTRWAETQTHDGTSSEFPSYDAIFTAPVYDTTNSQAETKDITLRAIGSDGADGSEPYRLAVLDNGGTELASFDAVDGTFRIKSKFAVGDAHTNGGYIAEHQDTNGNQRYHLRADGVPKWSLDNGGNVEYARPGGSNNVGIFVREGSNNDALVLRSTPNSYGNIYYKSFGTGLFLDGNGLVSAGTNSFLAQLSAIAQSDRVALAAKANSTQTHNLAELQADDAGGTARMTAAWTAEFVDNTASSFKTRGLLKANDFNAERELIRIEGTGSAGALAFFGASAVTQRTRAGQLTDNSGGSVDGTVASVGDTTSSDQSTTINNNFADLVDRINKLEQMWVDYNLAS